MLYRSFEARWKKLLDRAGLRHHGLHSLRHTHISMRIVDLGDIPAVVGKDVGQKDLATTIERYGSPTQAKLHHSSAAKARAHFDALG